MIFTEPAWIVSVFRLSSLPGNWPNQRATFSASGDAPVEPGKGYISGGAYDASTGRALPNATVTIQATETVMVTQLGRQRSRDMRGGWGASATHDGASGLIAVTDGDTYNYSIELLENKFPLLVRRYGYDVDGGAGAGRRRGGFGLVREYEVEADGANLHASFGRNFTPA